MSTASPPGAAPSVALGEQELGAWRGMLRVHAAVTQQLDAELRAAHGLSVSSYEVLMFLCDAEQSRLRMADIADRVLLSRSGLTRLLDRLVDRGLVARYACTDDGRGSYAQLTDAGHDKVDAARRTHLEGIRRVFLDRVSGEDQRALGDVWDKVLRA